MRGTILFGAIVVAGNPHVQTAEKPAVPEVKELKVPSIYGELKPKVVYGGVQQAVVLRHADKMSFALPSGKGAWLILPVVAPSVGTRPWVWFAPQFKGGIGTRDDHLNAGFAKV